MPWYLHYGRSKVRVFRPQPFLIARLPLFSKDVHIEPRDELNSGDSQLPQLIVICQKQIHPA